MTAWTLTILLSVHSGTFGSIFFTSTQVLRYSGTQVPRYSKYPGSLLLPQFKSWQADSMETPSIYGVLGVQKVINIHKKNVKEKNYESENDIGKS